MKKGKSANFCPSFYRPKAIGVAFRFRHGGIGSPLPSVLLWKSMRSLASDTDLSIAYDTFFMRGSYGKHHKTSICE
jgi:hypothetical protein